MSPGGHCPELAVTEALAAPGFSVGAAVAADAFGDDVADITTVGLGVDGDGPGHAPPYAAEGKSPGARAASTDECAVADPAGAGAGWAGVNCQASTATTAMPPARMKNRRRQ
jgi:hypothetical protein